MKKVVVLTGSPRRNGNINRMVDSFTEAAQQNGIQVVRYNTAAMKVSGCLACEGCYSGDTPCVQQDDFNQIVPELESADGIIWAVPVYWYSLPAQFKAVIDRLFCMYVAEKNFEGKKCALISCCEDESVEAFAGVQFAYYKSMELLKAESVGEVLIPGVYEAGAIEQTDGRQQAAGLAEKF